jgi:hypothetical protein
MDCRYIELSSLTEMNSDKRVEIARWANANKADKPWEKKSLMKDLFGSSDWSTVGSLALWAVGNYHEDFSKKSDEELKQMISLQYGFAADEKIDPSRVIKSPDQLVVGNEYRLASNGYLLGKYKGSQMSPSHPGMRCGCDGTQRLWSFDNGTKHGDTRGPIVWEWGIY